MDLAIFCVHWIVCVLKRVRGKFFEWLYTRVYGNFLFFVHSVHDVHTIFPRAYAPWSAHMSVRLYSLLKKLDSFLKHPACNPYVIELYYLGRATTRLTHQCERSSTYGRESHYQRGPPR